MSTASPDPDRYLTIAGPARTELRIQNSRFLAFAQPVTDAGAAQDFLESLRKEHYDATHHCSAWRLGTDGGSFRSSDDGEPSGTAGRRILAAIDHAGVTDLIVVVVRYFGGVKLGVGGLARAYAESAADALAAATVVERFIEDELLLSFPFEMTSQAHHVLERAGADVIDRDYGEHVTYRVRIRRSRVAACRALMDEATRRSARWTPADHSSSTT